jgi:hypothetical protein
MAKAAQEGIVGVLLAAFIVRQFTTDDYHPSHAWRLLGRL